MRRWRQVAMLLLAGLAAALAGACGEDGRSEDILECALPCQSDSECFAGQDCVMVGDGQGCCDRFQDRAELGGSLGGEVEPNESLAIKALGDSDVSGSWLRAQRTLFFLDGGAAYLTSDETLGNVIVLVAVSVTSLGDRDILKVYVPTSSFKPSAPIALDGATGRAEFWHNTYNFNEQGSITSLLASELLGVSYDGEVIVDETLAGTRVDEEFAVTLSVNLATP